MRAAIIAGLAASALAAAPAPVAAKPPAWMPREGSIANRLVAVGTWEFAATKTGPDGNPECYESWTFNADGTGVIVSSAQRVTTKWVVETSEDKGQLLVITNAATIGSPDCLGRDIDESSYPNTAPGIQLLFYGTGEGALVCAETPYTRYDDGSDRQFLSPEDCWGRIAPAAKK